MNSQPLFSVLIANYNNGKYLMEAVESVWQQTYSNWEIVLVDDGSTDNSNDLYSELQKDERIHIYHNGENKGCGFTKRRCAELAKGVYCGFLDPDDKLSETALEIMVDQHKKWPNCSIAYSTLFLWNDLLSTQIVLNVVGPMQKGEDFLISSKNCVSHFAVFKRSLYQKTMGIDPRFRSAVDIDLYLKLEEVGELHYVNIPLYFYRQTNPNSISIGNQHASDIAYQNCIVISLNAFCRRIKYRSQLFKSNKVKYLSKMRLQMQFYKNNTGGIKFELIRYNWWYLVGGGFSLKTFNHIRKIIF